MKRNGTNITELSEMIRIILLLLFLLPVAGYSAGNDDFVRGRALYSQKKFSAAEELLKKSIAASPLNPEAHFILGNIFFLNALYTDADRSYQRAIDLKTEASYYNAYAALKLKQNLPEVAEQLYLKSVRIDPSKYHAYEKLAFIYIESKKFEQASAMLKKVIEINSAHPDKEIINEMIQRLSKAPAQQADTASAVSDAGKTSGTGSGQKSSGTNSEQHSSGQKNSSKPLVFDIDLDKVGKSKEMDSKMEESITEIEIDLELVD